VSGLCNTDVDKNTVEISIQRMINSYICLGLEANLGSGITANLFCRASFLTPDTRHLKPNSCVNIPNSVLKEKNNEKFEKFGKLKAKFYRNV
jgi:hypothetical protein